MLIDSKRGSPPWWQMLALIVFGAVVSYICDAYGSFDPLTGIALFVGLLAFISGFAGFFAIAVKSLASSTGTILANAVSSGPAAILHAAPPAKNEAALRRLRYVVMAVIALACVDVWHWGGPPLTSRYGQSYWIQAIVVLFFSQIPYIIALVRIRKVADRAGIALILAGGMVQGVFILYLSLRHPYAHQVSWPWLSISLDLVAGLLAFLIWRSIPSRKSDAGLLISTFFSLVAYTQLCGIVFAIVRFELRKLF